MKLFSWWCPSCGDEAPGGARPRHDNPCRLCTDCSVRTKTLVARVRLGTYGKVEGKRPVAVAGVDLGAELDRLLRLPIMPKRFRKRPPKLQIRRLRRAASFVAGRAYFYQDLIEITSWPMIPPAEVLETLVHELGHLVTGPNKQPHGQEWRSNVLELAHDGYGVVPEMPKDVTTHAFDEAVIASLDGYLRKRAG